MTVTNTKNVVAVSMAPPTAPNSAAAFTLNAYATAPLNPQNTNMCCVLPSMYPEAFDFLVVLFNTYDNG